MKFYQPLPLKIFIDLLLHEDREVLRIIDTWSAEREEISEYLVGYYQNLGVFMVKPQEYARLLREDLCTQLKQNPVLAKKKNSASLK